MDYSKVFHIDDDTADSFVTSENPTGYAGWQKPDAPHVFKASRPVGETVPREQWPALIAAGAGNWLSDLVQYRKMLAKSQGRLNFCWAFGTTRTYEIARVVMGLEHVDLSPESLGGPLTNWRNVGGYASEAFEGLEQNGICESSFMDAPNSLSPSRWKAGWQEHAKQHRAPQWYEIGSNFDDMMTCLLNRMAVAAGLSWWRHLVAFLDPLMWVGSKLWTPGDAIPTSLRNVTFGVLMQNSWGTWNGSEYGFATLQERKATPDGAACPIIVTPSEE